MLYFEAASTSVADNQECASLVRLQTTLCLALYLLNTSKLDLARPVLETICASPVVHELFQDVSTQTFKTPALSDVRRRDLVWTIVYLDMHVSGLLGLSSFLRDPGPEIATVHAINTAAYDAASRKRSGGIFLLSVSVAMAIELMKLICRISLTTTVVESLQHGVLSSASDIPDCDGLRAKFDTWEFVFRRLFPENDCDPALSL